MSAKRRSNVRRASVELEWVKPAQQDRSRDTHARIVAAAERLLSRGRSWAELSVADLVDEADASVGAFYNRFRDKDALLHVLQLELCAQGAATALDQMLLYDDQAPTGRKITDAQLTEELSTACLGYLHNSLPLRG